MKIITAACLLTLCCASATLAADAQPAPKAKAKAKARAPHPSLAKIEDEPGLPRVLLIGDSISMGYTLDVRAMLKGKANVHRIPTNGGHTKNGLTYLKDWLGASKWDVIHFNWGLHDLKYLAADNKTLVDSKAPGAKQQVPLAEYEKNLTALVEQLKATGAKLIWCKTTPVPQGADGRVEGDEVKYNEAADRVMKAAGVVTDDLWTRSNTKKEGQLPANVHYSPEGYKYLGEQVAKEIEAQLPKK